jgi:hypothetical protein
MHHILGGVYDNNKPTKAQKGVIIAFFNTPPNQLWKKINNQTTLVFILHMLENVLIYVRVNHIQWTRWKLVKKCSNLNFTNLDNVIINLFQWVHCLISYDYDKFMVPKLDFKKIKLK